ncbi:hypothetical protein ACNR9Q_00095 [Maribacter sp. X9]|uniref:hypothetical protein n=1 Tax=Maribacter sp. X9 TaxID=3402159 RepID=UPI003AF3B62A
MKKLMLAIFVMVGISAVAQDHNMKGKRNAMMDFTPEQIATLQTKKMTLALDLSDSQQSKIEAMFMEDAKIRKAKMETFKKRKESGEKMSTDEKFNMLNERLDRKIERKKEMKSLLSPEQYAQYEKIKHSKGMHHKKNRDGRKKEMGPKRG